MDEINHFRINCCRIDPDHRNADRFFADKDRNFPAVHILHRSVGHLARAKRIRPQEHSVDFTELDALGKVEAVTTLIDAKVVFELGNQPIISRAEGGDIRRNRAGGCRSGRGRAESQDRKHCHSSKQPATANTRE
ncbi:hypothetical protein FFT87_00255 [Salinibacterium sp. M195]|nr:hypothetical protein FFT87_00255 [Salinibacterium sp. M195]